MIDDTVQRELQQKGFGKHVVLLNSKYGLTYFDLLSSPKYRDAVIEAWGRENYERISKGFVLLQRMEGLEIKEQKTPPRSAIDSIPWLQVTIEKSFDEAVFRITQPLEERLQQLVESGFQMIYRAAKRTIGNDEKRIYAIYKDTEHISETLTKEEIAKLRENYEGWLENRAKLLKSRLDMSTPDVIINNTCNLLREILPLYDQVIDPDMLLVYAQETLKDQNQRENNFQEYINSSSKTRKKRVVAQGRDEIARSLLDLHSCFGSSLCNELIQTWLMYPKDLEDTAEICDPKTFSDPVAALFSASTVIRKEILEEFESSFSGYIRTLHGMEQLLSGGHVLNPNADPESVMQNDARFPNIRYSPRLMKKIEAIVREAHTIVDDFPDISDLVLSTKARKVRSVSYAIEELSKDPLDITFGNDAGCCIFVPEDAEKMHNGVFVPLYLAHPGIHLFATYKQDGKRKQRMGLVLAFDGFIDKKSKDKNETETENVLICNSLELSRLGIVGGRKTIDALTGYEEAWLERYAQAHGYKGVAMGIHDYNTSVNYSRKIGDTVREKLCFDRGLLPLFYSDIFMATEGERIIKTRENGCYWIWKEK